MGSGYRKAPVEDEAGHAADTDAVGILDVRDDEFTIFIAGEAAGDRRRVEPDIGCEIRQGFTVTDVEALAEVRREQALHHVVLDAVIKGDTVTEVLNYVQYSAEKLTDRVRKDVERAVRQGKVSLAESRQFLQFYERGLEGYTYLEEPSA